MAALGVEYISKQMLSFKEIPCLLWVSLESFTTVGAVGRCSYQARQVSDVDSASPGHLKNHFWRPIDMRLDKGAGLVFRSYSCLPKVTHL